MAGLQEFYLRMQTSRDCEMMLRWLQLAAFQNAGIEFTEEI